MMSPFPSFFSFHFAYFFSIFHNVRFNEVGDADVEQEWRNMFISVGVAMMIGAVVYCLLGTGKRQQEGKKFSKIRNLSKYNTEPLKTFSINVFPNL